MQPLYLRQYIAHTGFSQCYLCGLALTPNDNIWCQDCRQRYFVAYSCCSRCGLATNSPIDICGQCMKSPPPWDRLISVSNYQFPLNEYVHKLKYKKQYWLANDLSSLLAEKIDRSAPIITSVPLHWSRFVKRSFNQSDYLAYYLSKHLPQCHYQPMIFKRIKATKNQQSLTKKERKTNLLNAFALNKLPKTDHIAIVDDVVTSGSTVRQLCYLLKKEGIKRVDIYCICRTPEPNS